MQEIKEEDIKYKVKNKNITAIANANIDIILFYNCFLLFLIFFCFFSKLYVFFLV